MPRNQFVALGPSVANNRGMDVNPTSLLCQIESFLADHPRAAMVEGGEVIFRFDQAQHTLKAEGNRCLLQVWSEERNIVRRVTAAEWRKDHLRLTVQRFGQSKPAIAELVPQEERRPASAKRVTRGSFQRVLRRALERHFPGWKIESLSHAADLEHSFGPVHMRGIMRQGKRTVAVAGPRDPNRSRVLMRCSPPGFFGCNDAASDSPTSVMSRASG